MGFFQKHFFLTHASMDQNALEGNYTNKMITEIFS